MLPFSANKGLGPSRDFCQQIGDRGRRNQRPRLLWSNCRVSSGKQLFQAIMRMQFARLGAVTTIDWLLTQLTTWFVQIEVIVLNMYWTWASFRRNWCSLCISPVGDLLRLDPSRARGKLSTHLITQLSLYESPAAGLFLACLRSCMEFGWQWIPWSKTAVLTTWREITW